MPNPLHVSLGALTLLIMGSTRGPLVHAQTPVLDHTRVEGVDVAGRLNVVLAGRNLPASGYTIAVAGIPSLILPRTHPDTIRLYAPGKFAAVPGVYVLVLTLNRKNYSIPLFVERPTERTPLTQHGTTYVGPCIAQGCLQTYYIKFPVPFSHIPTVTYTPMGPQMYWDTFGVVVYQVSREGFWARAYRVEDPGKGWAQQLYVNWIAIDNP